MKKKIEKNESEIHIHLILDKDEFRRERLPFEKEILKKVKVDGFREGKVPEDIARKHVDPMYLLEKSAHEIIIKKLPEILGEFKDEKIVDGPHIQITKLSDADDLEFSVNFEILPSKDFKLADYHTLAREILGKEIPPQSVSEEELKETLLTFRKMRAQNEKKEKGDLRSWNEIPEEELPPLDDEYIKKLGNFSSLRDFEEKIRESIQKEKELKELEKQRIELIEKLIEKSSFSVPKSLVERELNKMLYEFEANISATGISFDAYLQSIKKTKEDYRKEWREQAEKRVRIQLILDEIARRENIKPFQEEIERETKALLERYKNEGIDGGSARAYVEQFLRHQKVFQFLDSFAKEKDLKEKKEEDKK